MFTNDDQTACLTVAVEKCILLVSYLTAMYTEQYCHYKEASYKTATVFRL